MRSLTSQDRVPVPSLTMEDLMHAPMRGYREFDLDSVQSGLATLPDSSYAGFERIQPPSSTPNRPQVDNFPTSMFTFHYCY